MTSNLVFPDDQIWTDGDFNRQSVIRAYSSVSTDAQGYPVVEMYNQLQGGGIRLEIDPEKVTTYVGGQKAHILDLQSGRLSLAFNDTANIFGTYYGMEKTIKTMLTVNADAIEKIRQTGPKA